MKPTTKKTIIIIVAVLIVATIVWLVLRTKCSFKAIINKLDFSNFDFEGVSDESEAKMLLLKESENVKAKYSKSEIEAEAQKDGLNSAKEIVYWAAVNLREKGYFNVTATDLILSQLKAM